MKFLNFGIYNSWSHAVSTPKEFELHLKEAFFVVSVRKKIILVLNGRLIKKQYFEILIDFYVRMDTMREADTNFDYSLALAKVHSF